MDENTGFLELLSQSQRELSGALESLAGKRPAQIADSYVVYCARLANQAIEGFVYLRESERAAAAKLLVRPTIEAIIRARAVQKKPEVLFRVAFSEFAEDKKWIKGAAPQQSLTTLNKEWDDFKSSYTAEHPSHSTVEASISTWDLAHETGLTGFYEIQYRMYCQFTHGALRASSGALDDLSSGDCQTMAACCIDLVEAVIKVGGEAPNLATLCAAFERLSQPTSAVP